MAEKKSGVLVEFTPEEGNELRAAFRDAGGPLEGFASLKLMIREATMIYVAALQEKHNQGRPFARPGEVVTLRRGQRTLAEEGKVAESVQVENVVTLFTEDDWARFAKALQENNRRTGRFVVLDESLQIVGGRTWARYLKKVMQEVGVDDLAARIHLDQIVESEHEKQLQKLNREVLQSHPMEEIYHLSSDEGDRP